jgi:2-isopropylmalate synthase
LVLCDTNGGTLPDRAEQVVRELRAVLGEAALDVHFHNDAGCAVASSLAAVRAGVRQVQGCMNGYGERTGNADLCSVLPNLVLKMGVEAVPAQRLARLAPTARQIAEIMNAPLNAHHPFVGTSAFAHKAGLHSSGLVRIPHAYEHIDPVLVGSDARNLVSELMGRSTVLTLSRHRGWELDAEAAQGVVDRVKELEHRGYQFEAADGSFELLVRHASGWQGRPFGVDAWRVAVENAFAEATVELTFGEGRVAATRRGDGPVNALDQALRAAVSERYPQIGRIRLTDYRARDLDTREGSAGRVRVLAQWSDGASVWGTVGVDRDIIGASWEALVDGIVVGLLRSEEEGEDLPAAAAVDGG